MKVLLTGFAPFGGEAINPSYEAIKALPALIGDTEIVKIELPTVFNKSINVLYKKIKETNPDIVLCIGQAGGRYDLTLERVAINLDDARIPDNEGNQPIDEPVYLDGETAYFSNLPIKTMVAALRKNNIPASVSNSAGTFVCNHIMYGLMHFIKQNNLKIRGGFMHVPYIAEQVIGKGNMPFMTLEMISEGIMCAVRAAAATEADTDLKSIEGKLD